MKKIVASLSEESINKAIKELREYKRKLARKANNLVKKMCAYGEDFAVNQVSRIDTGETVSSIHAYRNGNKGVIVAGGNAIWIEFGTGIRYNGAAGASPHPKGEELNMKIGEYGAGHGADPSGWWYYDGNKVKHTFGIKGNMFMYKTAKELARLAPEMAREVFTID